MDKRPDVSRTQRAFLAAALRAGTLLGLGPSVPMTIATTLCEFYFSAAPLPVLRGLRHMGYVDFDGMDGNGRLRIRRLPRESEVLPNSEEPLPLPRGDSIEHLVAAYHARRKTSEQDLGREQNEAEDTEPPGASPEPVKKPDARRKPDTRRNHMAKKPAAQKPTAHIRLDAQAHTLAYLANHLRLQEIVGGVLNGRLSIAFTKAHWPESRYTHNHRQTLKERGLIELVPGSGWRLTPHGEERCAGVSPTLGHAQINRLLHTAGILLRHSA
ncbi:hypothetical protein HY631_04200 [Candidatus Uhrbacteria bacterium]|nr:hypothetical protein [Candidatus Uhrbacteria bacterium]